MCAYDCCGETIAAGLLVGILNSLANALLQRWMKLSLARREVLNDSVR
jgi:hypothetical protein